MSHKFLAVIVSIVLLASSILTACAVQAPTPTPATTKPAAAAPQAQPQKAKKVHIDLSTTATGKTSSSFWAAEQFAKEVEAASGGSMDVSVYLIGQLGGTDTLPEMLRTGAVPMWLMQAAYFQMWAPWVSVLSAPGLFDSDEQAWKAYDGWLGGMLSEEFENNMGVKIVGHMPMGFKNFVSKKGPITKPADLKGMKMRSVQTPIDIATWSAWGAVPTNVEWADTFPAFQQGVLDGMDSALYAILPSKLNEVAKYVTVHNGVYSEFLLGLNKKFYDGLAPDQQKALQSAGKAFTEVGRKRVEQDMKSADEQLRAAGVTVTRLAPEQFQLFASATDSLRQDLVGKYGEEARVVVENSRKK